MLERDVRAHLRKRAKQSGGELRAMKWLGRNHAPDDCLLMPGEHFLIEGKRPGQKPRPGQAREHVRLHKAGFAVLTLDSIEAVDAFFTRFK